MGPEGVRIIAGLLVSIGCMVLWPRYIRLNSFFSLLFACFLFSIIAGLPLTTAVAVMQQGFGSLLQQIGIIVALGAVLGTILEKTGATETISTGLLKLLGTRRPVLAISLIGALVGIPVFCDSGFIILSRLIPSIAAKTAASSGALTLALASGLYTTHVLVPPTPGPLAAAANLGVGNDLGIVMIIGLIGTMPVIAISYLYALFRGPKIQLSLTEKLHHPDHRIHWLHASLPLILPIILIAAGSFVKQSTQSNFVYDAIGFTGSPIIALLIGLVISLTLIDNQKHKDWPEWITQALKEAGLIILITGAGGAFGTVIKASGLDKLISSYASGSEMHGIFFLFFAWFISAIIKTAQGSSTSAMIITSALMAPLAASAGLSGATDLSILVLAIGGGAFTVSHTNDSYFWVVSQFGGINTKDGFAFYTPMTLLQGLSALITSIILFYIL